MEAPLRSGDLVLCKLRNGYTHLVLVLNTHEYQLWSVNTDLAHRQNWRYLVLSSNGSTRKMQLKPAWLLQRVTGGGQDGQS
jgi:hypothetical protein